MNPSYNGSFGTGNPGGQVPGGFGSGSFGGAPQGMTPQGFASQGQPIGSGGGDIVLGVSGEQRKSKKWLVVVGVVVMVVLVVLMVMMGVRGNGNSAVISNDAKTAFNRYANYFLYGDSKNDEMTDEIPALAETAFIKQTESISEGSNYFQGLKALFDTFNGSINSYLDEGDVYSSALIETYNSELSFITTYYDNDTLTREGILRVYNEGGKNKADEYIRELSDPFKNVGIINDFNYYNLMLSWGDGNLSLIMFYEKNGCLNEGQIDYDCAAQKTNDESKMISSDISKNSAEMDMVLNNSKTSLYYNLTDLNKFVNAEKTRSEDV